MKISHDEKVYVVGVYMKPKNKLYGFSSKKQRDLFYNDLKRDFPNINLVKGESVDKKKRLK